MGDLKEDEVIDGYSVGMGFFIPSFDLFGLPERADTFHLNFTDGKEPIRLFNQDVMQGNFYNATPLYGNIPYVTGHSKDVDVSIAWMNSAEGWVDIFNVSDTVQSGSQVNFLFEGGPIEFYTFSSAVHPKRVQKILSTITGFAPMPPLHSLGYHFSKYENTSAEILMQRNADFTKYGYPVDVFWMDIMYAEE